MGGKVQHFPHSEAFPPAWLGWRAEEEAPGEAGGLKGKPLAGPQNEGSSVWLGRRAGGGAPA